MGRIADKNILISGGNGGIGLAAAQDFDREGARVAVKLDHVTRTYRRDKCEVRALAGCGKTSILHSESINR